MTRRLLALCLAVPTLVAISAAPRAQTPAATALVERVGDTAFIQIEAESFKQLDAKQQALAYWLTQASIAIDPIIYDQLSRFGLREKRLLEEIVARPAAVAPGTFAKIRSYALLFWANRGNHNENTTLKFLPTFTFAELRDAALKVQAAGGFKTPYGDLPALPTTADVTKELEALKPALFDPDVEPSITAKTPPAGQDILQASSNTFYQGVTLADLANFQEQYPLNSRVVKGSGGALHEDCLSRGHAGRKDRARPVRGLSQEGHRLSREGASLGRSGASEGDRRAHHVLPDGRPEGLAPVRLGLGAQ